MIAHMGVAPKKDRTLAEAMAAGAADATILDDPGEVEDAAVYAWLKGHAIGRGGHRNLVIHYQPLPAVWRAKTKTFVSQKDAETFLRRVAGDRSAMQMLRKLCQDLNPQGPTEDRDVVPLLAGQLINKRLWAIEAKRAAKRYVSKTSPSAFAPINPKFGTAVDFAYIAELEGDQWLRGYVPFDKAGKVIGRSGMTVASGFDVGQWSAGQIDKMGFTPALVAKIKPFADLPLKGKTKKEVAAIVAKKGPVPLLTKDEADLCDGIVFTEILRGAINSWNGNAAKGVPGFNKLPAGWQTVWLSRFYQEGPATKVPSGVTFRNAARAGKYTEAVTALKGYTKYTDRTGREAKLLESAMPPPLPPPPPKPGAPAAPVAKP